MVSLLILICHQLHYEKIRTHLSKSIAIGFGDPLPRISSMVRAGSCSCGQKSLSKVRNLDGFQGAFNWLFAGFGLEKLNQVQFQMSSSGPNSSSN